MTQLVSSASVPRLLVQPDQGCGDRGSGVGGGARPASDRSPGKRAILWFGLIVAAAGASASCKVHAKDPAETGSATGSPAVSVGVVKVTRKNLGRTLTV